MAKVIKRILLNPWFIGITLIVLTPVIKRSVSGNWNFPWSAILRFLSVFLIKIAIPLWLLIVLSLATLLVIVFLTFVLLSPKNSHSAWLQYREDYFYKIYWRWNYSGSSVSNLVMYCPNRSCDMQMHSIKRPIRGQRFSTASVLCPECGPMGDDVAASEDELIKGVIQKIERNIRKIKRGASISSIKTDLEFVPINKSS
ncbi:MAG: hypothetical protein KAR40_15110 [Candidatus Sabulitectum sp.]|nr:hypothetical protein [Candidatus Sabulitectum sp.]